ncbi:hypothetical protein J7M22_11765 [Candidatus Poribacteria bacterium]|nr:hypothetical protein [Candidatus Poribacteria bacterium]
MRRISILIPLFILIAGLIPISQAEDQGKVQSAKTGAITGKVIWKGHDLSQVTVQVYKDSSLKDLYSTGFLLNKKGDYQLVLEPGRYYVAAFVDVDKDGKMDEGDGIGMYGITDWSDPKQDKKVVEVKEGDIVTDIDIYITAVLALVDGKLQVVPVQEYEARPTLQEELERISTGVSGKVILEKGELKNGLVFAYTDLSWKNRVAQTKVDPDGSFKMNLSPGKYYILAVLDLNGSNLFDAGDMFGIYGIDDLKSKDVSPRPVLVEPRRFTSIQIKIVGKRLEGGGIAAIGEEVRKTILEAKSAKVKGRVIWDGHSLERCVVQFYRDPTFTKAVEAVGTAPDGSFTIMLPPGDYYLLAEVDVDGDGKYSAGDGIGAYGSDDITQKQPRTLHLKQGLNPDVMIRITGVFTKGGQIVSLNPKIEGNEEVSLQSGITGRVIWDGRKPSSALILVSEKPDFQNPAVIPVQLNEDGSYSVDLPRGTYYIMAVIDSDSDGKADGGDGFGIYGTMNPISGKPVPVSVFEKRYTPYINIYIRGAFTDDTGDMAVIDDANRMNIKAKYGPPDDVFSYAEMGKQIEEWYYWREGIAFKFEQSGLGWVLKESEKFTPKNLDKLKKKTNNIHLPFNVLYYSSDDIVWGLSSNGIRQALGFGSDPTSTTDGSLLVYIDLDGHIRLSSADNVEGRIILKRSEMAEQPVISPDGDFIAYIKRIGDQRKLFIRFIKTGDEIQVPTSAKIISDPCWNLNSELVAFAMAGAAESNPSPPGTKKKGSDGELQRDIYCYDIVDNQIDPLVLSPADDAEPSWCPTDPDRLAFSRETDGHRQIWVITFYRNKPPEEEQLTKYGGEHPIWLPDGTGIIYETNGQIWLVDVRTKISKPIMVEEEPVFGFYPFVR